MGFYRVLDFEVVAINGAIMRVTILISHIRGLITRLITTHEPPSCGEACYALLLKGSFGCAYRFRRGVSAASRACRLHFFFGRSSSRPHRSLREPSFIHSHVVA